MYVTNPRICNITNRHINMVMSNNNTNKSLTLCVVHTLYLCCTYSLSVNTVDFQNSFKIYNYVFYMWVVFFFSDKNSPCCQNCQFMRNGVKCRDAQYATCEEESRCTGQQADCPKSPPMTDGTACQERGKCSGGKCIPFCETQRMQSCMCDVSK